MIGLRAGADLRSVPARTTPKTVDKDCVVPRIVAVDELQRMAELLIADNRVLYRAGSSPGEWV